MTVLCPYQYQDLCNGEFVDGTITIDLLLGASQKSLLNNTHSPANNYLTDLANITFG
jgi:hypothetical protein